METFSMPYLLPLLLLLPLSLYLIFFIGKKRSGDPRKLPPGFEVGRFSSDLVNPESLRRYLPVIDNMAREHLRNGGHWRPDSVVKVLPLTKKYSLELMCKILMDVVDPRVVALSEPISLLTKGMLSLPINLPGTAFNRALRGGREMRAVLLRFVEERRNEVTENMESEGRNDLMSKMMAVTDNDNIVNLIAGLLIAGQYKVSSALTVIIHFLAQLPHIYDKVLEEQMEIAKSKGPGELLAWEDVEKMTYTWNVVRESLRLLPPVTGGFGEVITEFTFAGFTIPKGWKSFWTLHTSHMNPDYFPEPEKFDPSRFEGSGPAPHTYVPFGGGPRLCPGLGYTKVVLLIFIHNLVTRFRFEKVIPNEKMLVHTSSTAPAHGLPLHLHRHKK